MRDFDPRAGFWIVGGDESRFWDSKAQQYVQSLPAGWTTDRDAAWNPDAPMFLTARIGTEADLTAYLAIHGLSGPVPIVPKSVTLYQGRAALIIAGLFDQVKAAVDAQGENSLAFQAFEYANHWYRDSPFIAQLAVGLGLTEQQIDHLFIEAAKQ